MKRTVLEPELSKRSLSSPLRVWCFSCSQRVIFPLTMPLISSRLMSESVFSLLTMSAMASVAISACFKPRLCPLTTVFSRSLSLRVAIQQRILSFTSMRRAESSLTYTGFMLASTLAMPKVCTKLSMMGWKVSSMATRTSSSAIQFDLGF